MSLCLMSNRNKRKQRAQVPVGWRGFCAAIGALLQCSCAFSPLPVQEREHGESWALLQHDLDRLATRDNARRKSPPLVVAVEDFSIRAIDPISTLTLWRHSVPVSGHLVDSQSLSWSPSKENDC